MGRVGGFQLRKPFGGGDPIWPVCQKFVLSAYLDYCLWAVYKKKTIKK